MALYSEHTSYAKPRKPMQIDPHYQKISNILESITDGFYAVDRDWMLKKMER